MNILNTEVTCQKDIYNLEDTLKSNCSEKALKILGKESSNLEFLGVLQVPSQRIDRVERGKTLIAFMVVGGKFKSKKNIKVPRIPLDISASLEDILKVLTWEPVKAGEEFNLTYLEYLFLVIQPQYAGYCINENAKQRVSVCFRTSKFLKGQQTLPSPTFRMMHGGSVKDNAFNIEYFDGDYKVWRLYPEYEDKFLGYYYKKSRRVFNSHKALERKVEENKESYTFYEYLDKCLDFKGFSNSGGISKTEKSTEYLDWCLPPEELSFSSATVCVSAFLARFIFEYGGYNLGWWEDKCKN